MKALARWGSLAIPLLLVAALTASSLELQRPEDVGVTAGYAHGWKILGSKEQHHMVLLALSCGFPLRGRFELRPEILFAEQVHPEGAGTVGVAGHIRYNLTETPSYALYVGGGAGVVWTEIGEPDLGGPFQLNLLASTGLDYKASRNTVIGLQLRYVHLSSAGVYSPNRGVNATGAIVTVRHLFK